MPAEDVDKTAPAQCLPCTLAHLTMGRLQLGSGTHSLSVPGTRAL